MKNKILLVFAFLVAFLMGAKDVSAESFSISELDLGGRSSTIFVDDPSYNDLTVNTNVTFYELQDYVIYKVELTNNTEYDYVINGISDDNEDEHITVDYDLDKKTIKSGESGTLDVKLTFSRDLSRDERLSADHLYYLNALNIRLDAQRVVENAESEEGAQLGDDGDDQEVSEVPEVPDTGDRILEYVIVLAISGVGLVLTMRYGKRVGVFVFVFGISAVGLNYTSANALNVEYVDDDIIVKFEDSTINIVSPKAKWTTFENEVINRDNVQTMKFVSWEERPENPTGSFDISINHDEAVIEYYVLDTNTNLYDVYITSPYGYTRYYNDDMRIYIGDETNADMSKGLFSYMPNMTSIDFEYLDMYNITNTSHLFDMIDYSTYYWDCNSSLKSITWGKRFNTVNIEDMSYMFAGLDKLEEINLEDFDVSNVTNLDSMFARDEKLEDIEVSTWDTSNVTSLVATFYQTKNLKNIDVSDWDTSNVTTMLQTFYESGVEELDLSKWDTSKVTTMRTMFALATNLKNVDVSTWDTSNVTDMTYMFRSCSSLKNVDVSNWDTSNVTSMAYMFYRDGQLTDLDVSHWDVSKVTTMLGTFFGLSSLTTLDVSHWDTSNVTTMQNMFREMTNLTSIDVSNFDTSNVTNMSLMFYQDGKIDSLDVLNFDTSNVTDMSYMFAEMTKLKKLDLSSFNTSKVTTMQNMFYHCDNIEKIDFKNLDVSKASSLSFMFHWDNKLKNVYVKEQPTYKAGADRSNMWRWQGDNLGFTVWDYETNGSPLS